MTALNKWSVILWRNGSFSTCSKAVSKTNQYYIWRLTVIFVFPYSLLTSHHLPLTDWKPQVDISGQCQGPSRSRSRDHHPVTRSLWLSVSPPHPWKPSIILRESQHDGFPTVSNLGGGCHCSSGQAGFVNTGSLDRCSAPKTSSSWSIQTFPPSPATLRLTDHRYYSAKPVLSRDSK